MCKDKKEEKEELAKRGELLMPFADIKSFEAAQRMATPLASSDMVPKAYQGKIGNCLIALEMANRLGASPLMVMQNLYIVHGTPSWSSKFLIACFNTCGRFSPISYEDNISTETDKKKWYCRAKSVSKETGEQLTGTTITWEMVEKEGWATKDGSKWKTMPEQMMKYRAAAFFIRTVAPEISFGFHTTEEVLDMRNTGHELIDIDGEAVKVETFDATVGVKEGSAVDELFKDVNV